MKVINYNKVIDQLAITGQVYFSPTISLQHASTFVVDSYAIRPAGTGTTQINIQIQLSNDEVNWRTLLSYNTSVSTSGSRRSDDYYSVGYRYARIRLAKTSSGTTQNPTVQIGVTTKGHYMYSWTKSYDTIQPTTGVIEYTENIDITNQSIIGWIGQYSGVGAAGNLRVEGSNDNVIWTVIPSNPSNMTHSLTAGGNSFALSHEFCAFKFLRIRINVTAGSVTNLVMSICAKGF